MQSVDVQMDPKLNAETECQTPPPNPQREGTVELVIGQTLVEAQRYSLSYLSILLSTGTPNIDGVYLY